MKKKKLFIRVIFYTQPYWFNSKCIRVLVYLLCVYVVYMKNSLLVSSCKQRGEKTFYVGHCIWFGSEYNVLNDSEHI